MCRRITDLGADFPIRVAESCKVAYRPEQCSGKGLTPGDVLDQALNETVLFGQVR